MDQVDAGEPRGDDAPDSEAPWLNRGVLAVGGASLCSDAGHELVTSLLPSFLASTLYAGPATLGAIEGISDALVGVSKLAAGRLRTIRADVPVSPRAVIW